MIAPVFRITEYLRQGTTNEIENNCDSVQSLGDFLC